MYDFRGKKESIVPHCTIICLLARKKRANNLSCVSSLTYEERAVDILYPNITINTIKGKETFAYKESIMFTIYYVFR